MDILTVRQQRIERGKPGQRKEEEEEFQLKKNECRLV